MEKLVNGKQVDVGDIRLFELGFAGVALNKLAVSSINTTIDKESEIVKTCIESYHTAYRSLPFPLQSIETNVKYAAIANYMKHINKEISKLKMWVDKSLYVMVEDNKALNLMGISWGMVNTDANISDNTSLELYKTATGYAEFKWALEQLKDGKSLISYYGKFMPDFLKACNRDPNTLRKELSRALVFEDVPLKMTFENNVIIDVDKRDKYTLDIYLEGMHKTGRKIGIFDLTSSDGDYYDEDEYYPVYGLEVYKNAYIEDDRLTGYKFYGPKLKVKDINAFNSIFEKLLEFNVGATNACETSIKGFIKGDKIFYQINDRVFTCSTKRYTKSCELVQGVEMHSIRGNKLYLSKQFRSLINGKVITKEVIYSMDVFSYDIKICRISYR